TSFSTAPPTRRRARPSDAFRVLKACKAGPAEGPLECDRDLLTGRAGQAIDGVCSSDDLVSLASFRAPRAFAYGPRRRLRGQRACVGRARELQPHLRRPAHAEAE